MELSTEDQLRLNVLLAHEVEAILASDGVLTTDLALGLCGTFDIPSAEWAVVEDVESARVAARLVGYPVALKVSSATLTHKTEIGGVRLQLGTAAAGLIRAR